MMQRAVPTHIAIIMDGNGRWAKQKGLPRNEGHRRGTKSLEDIIKYAERIGVKYLTVYAFSTENWRRPTEEVTGLMGLFDRYLTDMLKKTKRAEHRFNIVGNLEDDRVPTNIREKALRLKEETRDNTGICFNLAFNYGGRDEIIHATKSIVEAVKKGILSVDEIDETCFESYLYTVGIPDPDLMIRTSGEERTSNFLPWQLSYTEFYFTNCLWPDFDEAELDKAIDIFNQRQRRFGKSE